MDGVSTDCEMPTFMEQSDVYLKVASIIENTYMTTNEGKALPHAGVTRSSKKLNGLFNITVNGTNSIKFDPRAPLDLSVVSWPPRKKLPWWLSEGYTYDEAFGDETYIYVIDNGVNIRNPVGLLSDSVVSV